ncbi:ferritin-like protein [Sorangium sp. So ce296]|uniref:ferritin-like domain-containing protein n=1 Tax=Sorangium sp. So ce296 TaxID=3133296 RepID=UPI003F62C281
MLRVKPTLISRLRQVTSQEELFTFIQCAIELEHSTIPPYLTALYSLLPGSNQAAADIFTSVLREEMLHMSIASNLLIALGGKPCFSKREFIPRYPGTLPMEVDDGLVVGLAPCSKDLIYNTFMRIEQPEHPLSLRLPDGSYSSYPSVAPGKYSTISEFYNVLLDKLRSLTVTWGQREAQVTPETTGTAWFRTSDWFPISSLETAEEAIQVIVTEGEGATTSPVDGDGDPAHFYRFGEIYYGAKMVHHEAKRLDQSWSYTGPAIPFDEAKVFRMPPNPKAADYPVGSRSRLLVDQFNQAYMQILLALDTTFNGQPRNLNAVLGLMYQLRILAYEVLGQPDPSDPDLTSRPPKKSTGLTFEYVDRVIS